MKNKHLIAIVLAILILVGVVYVGLQKSLKSSPASNLEECKVLKDNGRGAISIVFFSSKELAEKNMNFMTESSPFDENKDKFSFYYIDGWIPNCEMYKEIALFCHSKELIRKAASCPSDYIVVLQNTGDRIRSSSYLNVLSINADHPLTTLLHEFAHSFANLDDEYVPSELGFSSKNCFSKCEKFGEKIDGCFLGCSKENYYRSVEIGLMRTLSAKKYGEFDTDIISEILAKTKNGKNTISGKAIETISLCANERYYLVSGKFSDTGLEIFSKVLENGCAGTGGSGRYNYGLSDEEGNLIVEAQFNPELIFTDVQPQDSQTIQGGAVVNDKEFSLAVPFVGKPLLLTIKDFNGNEVKRIKLDELNNLACKIK